MFPIIKNIFKASVLGFFVDLYLKKHHSDEYELFKIDAAYNAIYFYSKFQIYYLKTAKIVKYLADRYNDDNDSNDSNDNNDSNDSNDNQEECINIIQFYNGDLHMKIYEKETERHFLNDSKNGVIGALYLFSVLGKNITNMVISRSQTFPTDYEVSNVNFILVELHIGERKLKIDLKNEEINYYIVSNILDKFFFLYYLFDHLDHYQENDKELIFDELVTQIDNAHIVIIDGNVNKVEVDFNRNGFVTLLKDDYTISHSTD